jgi:hypothetical protein
MQQNRWPAVAVMSTTKRFQGGSRGYEIQKKQPYNIS